MPFNPRFAANLSTMFDDDDFPDRFKRAKELGFDAVEAQFLYHMGLESLVRAKNETGMKVVMINSPKHGDIDYFEGQALGLACIPGQEIEFHKSLLKAIKYANALGCNKIHIVAGLKQDGFREEDLNRTYKQNLESAAECLEEHNMVGLIEPICPQVQELYFMDSFHKAVNVLSEVGSKNLKLLLDVYHLHMLEGDVENGIRNYFQFAGHVQISQTPEREEPFALGDIDHDKVFELLAERNYDGYIGLEYTPTELDTGYDWLDKFRVA